MDTTPSSPPPDEVAALRALAGHEARVLEVHLSLKGFPKSRRRFAEEQVRRMRAVAAGEGEAVYAALLQHSHTFRRAQDALPTPPVAEEAGR